MPVAQWIADVSHGTYVLARVAAHVYACAHVFAREEKRREGKRREEKRREKKRREEKRREELLFNRAQGCVVT